MTVPDPMEMLGPQAIAHHAGLVPDESFVQVVDGATLTWAQAHHESLRWAHALERRGVQAGEPVVSMFPNDIAAVLSWIGCAWLKAIEAPLNSSYFASSRDKEKLIVKYSVNAHRPSTSSP